MQKVKITLLKSGIEEPMRIEKTPQVAAQFTFTAEKVDSCEQVEESLIDRSGKTEATIADDLDIGLCLDLIG